MTTYEKCKQLRHIVLRAAAEITVYTNWGAEFAIRQLRELPGEITSDELRNIQPAKLTASQMEDLGFRKLSQDAEDRLIPLWLYPFLAEDIATTDIAGGTHICKSDMDTDNRFGLLAYAVRPAAIREINDD
jgi:hypothetical protein